MCGRYELHSNPAAIALLFGLGRTTDFKPRYNIAPMTDVPIVRVNAHGERELAQVRWGFVPRASRSRAIGAKLINARGETIAEKPAFRFAYRRHRCLLPADGFYEWMPVPGARGAPPRKQPMHIGMKDGTPFGIGGLYERWRGDDGEILDTCTIVTTPANASLAPVHDRMPLVVPREHYARWLDPAQSDVGELIVAYPAEGMALHPVSTQVNNVAHDDPTLIAPAAPIAPAECDEPPERQPEQESLF
jgi:putative SOS response-associated peptidase YedK